MRCSLFTILIASFLHGVCQTIERPPALIPVQIGELMGYCDSTGQIKIPAKWDVVEPFNAGVALFMKSLGKDAKYGYIVKYGLIDTAGNELLPAEYETIFINDSGWAYMVKDKKKSVRFSDGHIFSPRKYRIEHRFSGRLFVATYNRKWGVIDTNENVIIPFRYKYIGSMDKAGHTLVQNKNGRGGLIDKQGKFVAVFRKQHWDYVSDFHEGLAAVLQSSKHSRTSYGFIDEQGKLAISSKYQRVDDFREGFCSVTTNDNEAAFINRKGETLVSYTDGYTRSFQDGYGVFLQNNECGLIDTTGKIVLKVKGDILEYVNRNFIIVTTYDTRRIAGSPKCSLIDITGKELLPQTYNMIGIPENGLFYVRDDNHGYYMDMQFRAYRPITPANP